MGPDRGTSPATRSPVAVDAGASPLRIRAGTPPVPGGGSGEPPGRANPGAGLEREAGRGRAAGARRGATPIAVGPVGRSQGTEADSGAGTRPAEDLAGADDRSG